MRGLQISTLLWLALFSLDLSQMSIAHNLTQPTGKRSDSGVFSGGISPPDPLQRRLSKDSFKSFNLTTSTNNTSASSQTKRSAGKVEILEAGSNLRTRGVPRVLKRGSTSGGAPGAPGLRFADNGFTGRNSVTRVGSGYDNAVSFENSLGIPFVSIPGNNIPPPVYSYSESPPAPPPSPSVTINGVSSYGNYGSTIHTYRPIGPTGGGGGGGGGLGGGLSSTTPMPEIIFPPMTPEPGPQPIRPPTGTSVPIIGGGGAGGGSVLPPSPPPEEIFPPSPPPDEEFDVGVGRRLNVAGGVPGRTGGAPGARGGFDGSPGARGGFDGAPGARGGFEGAPGSPGARGGFVGAPGSPGARGGFDGEPGSPGSNGLSTGTRFTSSPNKLPPTSRLSSKETLGPLSSSPKLRSGGSVRGDRLRDKVKGFKTSVVEERIEPVSHEMLVDDPNVITDFVFSDIKCYKTRQSEYFGATIHMKSGFHLPYIRDRPQDPLTSECRLDLMEGTRGSYHMSVTDLRGCGVEQCGEAMCLTMVFPRVPMLALADDEVTTIKCVPQKSTMSDTKSINFAGDSTENRRSSSTVEGGIQEFVAEVGVFRQNPGSTNGLFVKRVNSGGVVQLGESLQLRSVVRGTDGWNHSKLTDVKVWRMRDNLSPKLDNLDPNDASEVITLVDPHGCRNDEYLVIAEEHPIKDPRNDMVHHFTFKAFLFRGQRVNEPLIVTARVHACQEAQDCVMECELQGRRKRSPVELHNASSIVHDFDSQLALRVVGLKDHPSSILDDEFPFDYNHGPHAALNHTNIDVGSMTCNDRVFATGMGIGCATMLVISLVTLGLYTYIKRGRQNAHGKPIPPVSHYRYPPPSGRPINTPYQKPLPPPPTTQPAAPPPISQEPQKQPSSTIVSPPSNDDKTTTRDDLAPMKKLLEEIISNSNSENAKSRSGGKSSSKKNETGKKMKEAASEYACIGETNSSSTSSTSSLEDLRKSKKANDGLYIVYCYDKDKKNNKVKLPMSAPSSTRMRRKHLRRMAEEDDDYDYEDGNFVEDGEDDSETMASQTEEPTDESDEYGELGNNNGRSNVSSSNNAGANIAKNQAVRRTVREVKKKSKQNNMLANASNRCAGRIRRRVSSVYREGYFNGLRGVVAAAVGSKGGGSFPLKHKKSPSTGNIPAVISEGDEYSYDNSGKRSNFSVRERRSEKKRRQHLHYRQYSCPDQYTSLGMLSEGTTMASTSDLDSAYSGSNCSKLTEVYDMRRNGGGNLQNASGHHPDFRNFKLQQNLMDVQRQLVRSGAAQGQNFVDKQELRRTTSSPSNSQNTSAVAVGLGSPPLTFGETKATHFVTRDDSTTKILIVPETHV